jgi:hypothetical protein
MNVVHIDFRCRWNGLTVNLRLSNWHLLIVAHAMQELSDRTGSSSKEPTTAIAISLLASILFQGRIGITRLVSGSSPWRKTGTMVVDTSESTHDARS